MKGFEAEETIGIVDRRGAGRHWKEGEQPNVLFGWSDDAVDGPCHCRWHCRRIRFVRRDCRVLHRIGCSDRSAVLRDRAIALVVERQRHLGWCQKKQPRALLVRQLKPKLGRIIGASNTNQIAVIDRVVDKYRAWSRCHQTGQKIVAVLIERERETMIEIERD